MSLRLSRTLLMAAASSLAVGAAASAQAPETGERRVIDVITVTAQQREESLQDVPLSVDAHNEAALENAGVLDIKDLIAITPGLMVTATQSETITTARIRGIGTVGDNFGLESSVGLYIDGVFRARNGVGFGDVGELERVEVLRGPQGTLFGKNTSAGVINIITAGPEFEFGGSAEARIGDYGYRRLSGHVTGPIVEDQLAFRLFAVDGERDGFTDLVVQNAGTTDLQESETQDYRSVRGQLLWTPNDRIEGRVIADYSERDELCCSAVQWDYTPTAAAFVRAVGGNVLQPADPEARIAFANRPYIQNVEDWGISAEFDVDFDFGELTSVTAFRNWSNARSQDIDYSSADLAFRDVDSNFTDIERFSQELRLNGVNGNLDWLVGGFFSHEDLELGDAIRFGDDWEAYLGRLFTASVVPPLGTPAGVSATLAALTGGAIAIPPGAAIPGGTGVNQDLYNQTATSWAAFTHNTYHFTDRLSLTAGLRYTREEKELDASFSTNQPAGCGALETVFGFDPVAGFVQFGTSAGLPAGTIQSGARAIGTICLPYARSGLDQTGYDQDRTDEEFSGTLRASYDVTESIMAYGGYSRGFKAGGFNLDREFNGPIDPVLGYTDVDTSFAPEIIDAFEAGFKSQLFGDVLQLNANVFYQEIDGFQLNSFTGTSFVVESIEEATSKGVEIDYLWLTPVEGLDISGGYAYVDAEYGESISNPGLAGKQMSLSPEHFLTSQLTYERPVFGDFMGLFSVDARYVSDYNTGSDLDPEKEQEAFTLWNARVGLSHPDDLWSVELWGKNLTDETYAQVAFDAFAQGSRAGAGTSNDPRGTASYDAFLAAPRTFGVTLKTEW